MNAPLNPAQSRQIAAAAPQTAVATAGFFDLAGFELMQRVAKAFSSSELVPKAYRSVYQHTNKDGDPIGQPEVNPNATANCMIALDMAQRIGANPLMVMQNLYIIHGTPGWSSKFLIATINACGRYTSLRYEWRGKPGESEYGCRAWVIERATGERLDGIWVDWSMVRAERWDGKNGSKWKTMPDQMFIYRAAAFWQRAYAPELGMGLSTAEELQDVIDVRQGPDGKYVADLGGDGARQQASKPAATAKPALAAYPADRFAEKLPEWRAIVESGKKTPEDLIAMLSTKAVFSDEQRSILAGLGRAEEVRQADKAQDIDPETGEVMQPDAEHDEFMRGLTGED